MNIGFREDVGVTICGRMTLDLILNLLGCPVAGPELIIMALSSLGAMFREFSLLPRIRYHLNVEFIQFSFVIAA